MLITVKRYCTSQNQFSVLCICLSS